MFLHLQLILNQNIAVGVGSVWLSDLSLCAYNQTIVSSHLASACLLLGYGYGWLPFMVSLLSPTKTKVGGC